ncbi:MAG TPA: hypothetical protein VM029_13285 [Opitutaceae bacterium]|nr:hypothetical protein [Opitutaceae bacterium]
MFRTAPGRFEVSAVEVDAARAVTAAADEAWRLLAAPLALPDAFSSPIFVRIVPAEEWREPEPFRVIVEAGAIVSLRVSWRTAPDPRLIRRAIVQALLMRLAVAHHGINERLAAPLWLEQACVGWWEARGDGAQLDWLNHRSLRVAPPRIDALLNWQRGETEDEARVVGATWLLPLLQAESAKPEDWPACLRRMLGGEAPGTAVGTIYATRFANAEERELWWQTGYHHLRRARTLPGLDAAESQAELLALQRFVVAEPVADADRLVAVRTMLDHAAEPYVAAELQRRGADLARILPALHPFFRNAGLSLAEVFAARQAGPARRDESVRAFEADWRDALELARASQAALDRLEFGVR